MGLPRVLHTMGAVLAASRAAACWLLLSAPPLLRLQQGVQSSHQSPQTVDQFGHGLMDGSLSMVGATGLLRAGRLPATAPWHVSPPIIVVVHPAAQLSQDEQLGHPISQAIGACWAVDSSEIMLAGACLLLPAQHEGQLLLGEWEP